MHQFLALVIFIVTLISGNRLSADTGIKTIFFEETSARYVYTSPTGWTEDISSRTLDPDVLIKFVRDDGKQECFLRLISYKKKNITEDDLVFELFQLCEEIYGKGFLSEKERQIYTYFDTKPNSAVIAMEYTTKHGDEQMVEFIFKATSGSKVGAFILLVKRNEHTGDLDEEFDAINEFIDCISFQD